MIKKYGNRRLYDTSISAYITLEQLAERIRAGEDIQVVDAKTGADLTQGTLTTIILESRGAARLLPVPLLHRLIRMEDDALSEFFGLFLSGYLELYLAAKRSAAAMMPWNPMLPFTPVAPPPVRNVPPAPPPIAAKPDPADEVAALRREVEALREALEPLRQAPAEEATEQRESTPVEALPEPKDAPN